MKYLREFSIVLFICQFVFPVYAQNSGVVVLNASSREIKRAAHRLRIPVEQMKNARQTLQEATELAKKIDPCPFDQFFAIAQNWAQLDRSKSKEMLALLIQDLRSKAAECDEFSCYQRATSVAMSLMQSNSDFDYEKISQLIRNWPAPKASFSAAAITFREGLETQLKRQSVLRLAGTDPEKALSLLSDAGNSDGFGYTAAGQIAQGLMGAGKRDEALDLMDQTIHSFDPNTADGQVLQDFENFVRVAVVGLDPARASMAVNGFVTAVMNQPSSAGSCGATLKAGGTSINLTCAESRILNLVRSFPMKPSFTLNTLDSVPDLKSKVDEIGGIDALYGGGGYGGTGTSIVYGMTKESQGGAAVSNPGLPAGAAPGVNTMKLIQELKGKDSAYVKGRLKDLSIDALINTAMSSAYQDPDLGAIALELAQQLLPDVEPLQRRASSIQGLIQAYRQVEGEVDPALLKNGFVLADELRQELGKTEAAPRSKWMSQLGISQADQLEAFLVSELSRTSYDSSIRYVRSMENNELKLACLLQIVQALSRPNF